MSLPFEWRRSSCFYVCAYIYYIRETRPSQSKPDIQPFHCSYNRVNGSSLQHARFRGIQIQRTLTFSPFVRCLSLSSYFYSNKLHDSVGGRLWVAQIDAIAQHYPSKQSIDKSSPRLSCMCPFYLCAQTRAAVLDTTYNFDSLKPLVI